MLVVNGFGLEDVKLDSSRMENWGCTFWRLGLYRW